VVSGDGLPPECIDAFGTYLHETIHWWQHVGSTTGLMLSFAYPAQAHVNYRHLVTLLNRIGLHKSLRTYLDVHHDALDEETRRTLNIVVNNWYDVDFNSQIIIDSRSVRTLAESPFFESVGHSLDIGLSHTIWMLAGTFDEEFRCMPDIRRWESLFADLRSRRVDGYYRGSPILLPPIGALHIFEGQARFSQIQYLYLSSGMKLSWEDLGKLVNLESPYIEAFKVFLEFSDTEWPDNPMHPVVNLFLLVCDLAINPSDGFPSDIMHAESFIESVDPAFRFLWFARHIRKNPALRGAITRCARDEYLQLAGELARSLICDTPVEIAQRVCSWPAVAPRIKELLHEESQFRFKAPNLPVRVLFSQFLRIAQDRVRRPEFFCWPGAHFISAPNWDVDLVDSSALFHRHEPLFFASIDGEVRPLLRPGKAEADIHETFNDFFGWWATYDLVRQWTINDGQFEYHYRWLTPTVTDVEARAWADRHFMSAFGVEPSSFQCADVRRG